MIFEDFDGDDLVRAFLPALDDLAERPATQELKDLVRRRQRVQHLEKDRIRKLGN